MLGTITVQALRRASTRRLCGMTAHRGATSATSCGSSSSLEVAVIPPNTPVHPRGRAGPHLRHPGREGRGAGRARSQRRTRRAARSWSAPSTSRSPRSWPRRSPRPGVACVVLNAKNDAEEAAIIAEAGAYGAVTVSTQMAGRGVDIRLGGSDQADRDRVAELGGLYVIGSGRHDSRRVDDQLRGRAGRQGDPGGSVSSSASRTTWSSGNAADAMPPSPTDRRRRPGRRRAGRLGGGHAQRVAEGVNHEIHRNTWRYSVVIEQQRKALAERRERVLTTDVAADDAARAVRRRRPRRWTRTCSTGSARSIALYHIDRLLGRAPGRCCPRSARACTCGRWAGSTRWTSSTGRRCRRSTTLIPEIEARTVADLRGDRARRGLGAGRRQAGPAERHLDLPGARQPVRLGDGPADRLGRSPARAAAADGDRPLRPDRARERVPLRRFDPVSQGSSPRLTTRGRDQTMTQATTPVAGRCDTEACDPVNLDMREPMVQHPRGPGDSRPVTGIDRRADRPVDDFDEALPALVRVTRDAVPGCAGAGSPPCGPANPPEWPPPTPRLAGLDDLRHGLDSPAMSAIHRREMILAADLAGRAPVAGLDRPRPTARRPRGDLRPGGHRRAGGRLDQPVRRPRRRAGHPAPTHRDADRRTRRAAAGRRPGPGRRPRGPANATARYCTRTWSGRPSG